MKRRHFLLSLGVLMFGSPGHTHAGEPHAKLLAAIRQVESGGNDQAIGDGGLARGPYQIHRAYWIDATAYGKVDWDYATLAHSEPHARQVVIWFWQRYRATTDEARARLHNAGPGWRKKMAATDGYWRKVQEAMR